MLVDVTPYFSNTTQKAYYDDVTNELRTYRIYPNDGYLLRDNMSDEVMEGKIIKFYSSGSVSVSKKYDFETNPREIEAVEEGAE